MSPYFAFHWHITDECGQRCNRKDHLWTLYEYEHGLFQIPAGAWVGERTEAYRDYGRFKKCGKASCFAFAGAAPPSPMARPAISTGMIRSVGKISRRRTP